ncbi:alpha/beta fold hydrolase [Aureisphaera galaxeae]|uniref:YheT family hydrolase n=1 Tax=Aureisphaera galaxeae TaxID=1538023 RepID=UPI002350F196|nr:alpha/beta fold hydrolase [Aureisphaera galaxeae]MDC8005325.1 alpha/beta fold hydrolase [Aureisphaera galaxeae]
MPKVASSYRAKGLYRNMHFATIYSAKLRPNPSLHLQRERLTLPDGDFMDLDFSFSEKNSSKIIILLHGLEGNARRTYMKGQAKYANQQGWDACAVNYRGCSGEENRSYKSYNAGKTDDLEAVIQYILEKDRYDEIALVGFSLGGNLLLKYLGEREEVPSQIKKGAAVSAPLHLEGSLRRLTERQNWVYYTTFLNHLKKKCKQKMKRFPDRLDPSQFKAIKSLRDFDDIYTAPAHGFKDAMDYYEKNSSLYFLPNVRIPVLVLSALNDSFLSEECYPFSLSEKQKNIYLETPKHGGHVGFHATHSLYYSEQRVLQFLTQP